MAQRCTRYKRVRSKFGGTVRRCASFSGRSSNGRRKRKYRRRGMARRGSHCVRYKRVRVRGQGIARRCAKYSGTRRSGSRRGYRGKAPFNKGRKCRAWGTAIRRGKPVRVCRSYGSTSGWRSRSGRRGTSRYAGRGTFLVPGSGVSVRPSRRPELHRKKPWWQRLLGTGD